MADRTQLDPAEEWPEAEALFYGNKDARSVVNIIQSRVLIYLDENRLISSRDAADMPTIDREWKQLP